MSAQPDPDRQAATFAHAVTTALALVRTPAQMDWAQLKATATRIRFVTLVQAGFDESQALILCARPVEL